MPPRTPHPYRTALTIIGITGIGVTAVVLTAAATGTTDSPDKASQVLPREAASSRPAANLPPPINRVVPPPLPPLTDPVGFATEVATTLWGTQAPDVVGYHIMAATSPGLCDPELDQLIQALDSEQISGPAEIAGIDLIASSGIDQASTVTVTALDPSRSLTLRITCTPECRLLGISR